MPRPGRPRSNKAPKPFTAAGVTYPSQAAYRQALEERKAREAAEMRNRVLTELQEVEEVPFAEIPEEPEAGTRVPVSAGVSSEHSLELTHEEFDRLRISAVEAAAGYLEQSLKRPKKLKEGEVEYVVIRSDKLTAEQLAQVEQSAETWWIVKRKPEVSHSRFLMEQVLGKAGKRPDVPVDRTFYINCPIPGWHHPMAYKSDGITTTPIEPPVAETSPSPADTDE